MELHFLEEKAPLVFLDRNQDFSDYTAMLEMYVIPWADAMQPNDWSFQEDNAPMHVSRDFIEWFSTEGISLLR